MLFGLEKRVEEAVYETSTSAVQSLLNMSSSKIATCTVLPLVRKSIGAVGWVLTGISASHSCGIPQAFSFQHVKWRY